MESRNEADEAEAHDKDDGGGDLQARGIVGVESKHVAAGAGTDRGRATSS